MLIYIIDDDSRCIEAYRDFLLDFSDDAEFQFFPDFEAANTKIEEGVIPDLIISDFYLENKTLLCELGKLGNRYEIPIYCVTGAGHYVDKDKLKPYNVVDYITKPIMDMEGLIKKILQDPSFKPDVFLQLVN